MGMAYLEWSGVKRSFFCVYASPMAADCRRYRVIGISFVFYLCKNKTANAQKSPHLPFGLCGTRFYISSPGYTRIISPLRKPHFLASGRQPGEESQTSKVMSLNPMDAKYLRASSIR